MFVLLEDVADFRRRPGKKPTRSRRVLRHLMDSPGWVSRDEIEDLIWGEDYAGGPDNISKALDLTMWRIRRLLYPGFYVERRKGFGVRFRFDDTAIVASVQRNLAA